MPSEENEKPKEESKENDGVKEDSKKENGDGEEKMEVDAPEEKGRGLFLYINFKA